MLIAVFTLLPVAGLTLVLTGIIHAKRRAYSMARADDMSCEALFDTLPAQDARTYRVMRPTKPVAVRKRIVRSTRQPMHAGLILR